MEVSLAKSVGVKDWRFCCLCYAETRHGLWRKTVKCVKALVQNVVLVDCESRREELIMSAARWLAPENDLVREPERG